MAVNVFITTKLLHLLQVLAQDVAKCQRSPCDQITDFLNGLSVTFKVILCARALFNV